MVKNLLDIFLISFADAIFNSSEILLAIAFSVCIPKSWGFFGDLGTSPFYVFYNTLPHGISDPKDVDGDLSLIIYCLTLIPLIKYIFVVCRANDSGQGGKIH